MTMKTYIELIDKYKKYQNVIELIKEAKIRGYWIALYTPVDKEGVDLEKDCVDEILEYYKNKMKEIREKLGVTGYWEMEEYK